MAKLLNRYTGVLILSLPNPQNPAFCRNFTLPPGVPVEVADADADALLASNADMVKSGYLESGRAAQRHGNAEAAAIAVPALEKINKGRPAVAAPAPA